MKKLILIAAVLMCSIVIVNAGEKKYSIGEEVTIHSELLDEDRSVIIYTPETYDLGVQEYPVMYLLDGEAHFHHASGIVQFLGGNGIIPEMIVVAVLNVDRTRDFSPTHVEKRPTSGGAEKFMGFLADELMPFVDKNFRTLTYDVLVGHSLGGEFAAYAMLNRPDIFNSYIAISPHMMYDDDFIVRQAGLKLKPEYDGVQFYMTVGDEPDYFKTLAEFEQVIENKSPAGLDFTYVKMENENHASIPHLSIYLGLESIYKDWKLSDETFRKGLVSIDHHYEKLSNKYGYEVATPEFTINFLGYRYLNKKQIIEAIEVFTVNVERFPESANVYDSLGEAYENDDQIAEAEKNYQKAVELAKPQKHPNLAIYEKNLKRMQDK